MYPKFIILIVVTIICATTPWADDISVLVRPEGATTIRARMIFSLGKSLRHRESYHVLVHTFPSIGSVSIFGISQLVFQIPKMDNILMGYWMMGLVRTITISLMCKSKLKMGENIFRRVLRIPYEMFLRYHLKDARTITLLVSVQGRFGGLGDSP